MWDAGFRSLLASVGRFSPDGHKSQPEVIMYKLQLGVLEHQWATRPCTAASDKGVFPRPSWPRGWHFEPRHVAMVQSHVASPTLAIGSADCSRSFCTSCDSNSQSPCKNATSCSPPGSSCLAPLRNLWIPHDTPEPPLNECLEVLIAARLNSPSLCCSPNGEMIPFFGGGCTCLTHISLFSV